MTRSRAVSAMTAGRGRGSSPGSNPPECISRCTGGRSSTSDDEDSRPRLEPDWRRMTERADELEAPAMPVASQAPAPDRRARRHLVISARRRWGSDELRELWEFRSLSGRLARRDITLRYRQTALGVIWVILQPLLAAGVFALVFGRVAQL